MTLGKQAACLRVVGDRNPDPKIAELELELQALGEGPLPQRDRRRRRGPQLGQARRVEAPQLHEHVVGGQAPARPLALVVGEDLGQAEGVQQAQLLGGEGQEHTLAQGVGSGHPPRVTGRQGRSKPAFEPNQWERAGAFAPAPSPALRRRVSDPRD